jgi:hypothetical protein
MALRIGFGLTGKTGRPDYSLAEGPFCPDEIPIMDDRAYPRQLFFSIGSIAGINGKSVP